MLKVSKENFLSWWCTNYISSSHHRKRIHRLPIINSWSSVSLLHMLLVFSSSFLTLGKVGKMVKGCLPHLQKYQTHSILVHCNVLAGSYHLEFLSLCLLREYLPTEITKVRIAGIRIIIWIPKIPSSTLLQIKDNHTGFCETLTGKKALRLRREIFYSSEYIYS